MSIYTVSHKTSYQYPVEVTLGHNEAWLIPRNSKVQKCLYSRLEIHPCPTVQLKRRDYFGNTLTYFSIQIPHNQMTVTAESQVQINPNQTADFEASEQWRSLQNRIKAEMSPDIFDSREYILASPMVPVDACFAEYASPSFSEDTPYLVGVSDFIARLHHEFEFDPSATTISTSVWEVLEQKRGVCQDFAHLAIACLRSLGLPAGYVSGYLETLPPPGKEKLVGADASHAWISVYDPDFGWVEFDPTNNKIADEQYIRLAWGRDYSDIPPLRGVTLGGTNHTLEVAVDVLRHNED